MPSTTKRPPFQSGMVLSYVSIATMALLALALSGALIFLPLLSGRDNTDLRALNVAVLSQAARVLAAAASDPDNDGIPEGPAWAAGSGPGDGGVIPATAAAPKTDAYRRPLGYCVWDNGQIFTSANRLSGNYPPRVQDAALAVISAGPDGAFQTTCALAAANRAPSGDDGLRLVTHAEIRLGAAGSFHFGRPVANAAALSALDTAVLKTGEIRLVQDSNKLYAWSTTAANAWAEIALSGGGGGPVSPSGGRNWLGNGAFSVWQRSDVISCPTPPCYTADRWKYWTDASTATNVVRQEISTSETPRPVGAFYQVNLTVNDTATESQLWQPLPGVRRYSNRTVTFSFWGKGSGGSKVRACFRYWPAPSTPGSETIECTAWQNTDSTWRRFSFTHTIPDFSATAEETGSSLVRTEFVISASQQVAGNNAIAHIAQAQVEEGAGATNFEIRPANIDWMQAYAYYECTPPGLAGMENNVDRQSLHVPATALTVYRDYWFRAEKVRPPAVSYTNTSARLSDAGTDSVWTRGFLHRWTTSSTGMGETRLAWCADSGL